MGCLCTNSDDCRGVVGDVFIVERKAGGTYEFGVAMFGFVLDGLREDGREGVDSIQLIIWNDHEEGKERFPDGKQVVIRWFPFKRGKGVVCLFEETGDGVRRHGEMKLTENLLKSSFLGYSRASAVENRDDDDQSDSIGEGELRVLGAFGDSSESVGSRDCDCSSGSFVGIKFELDFHCRERLDGPVPARI